METISFACKNVPVEQVMRCGLGLSKGEYELLRLMLKKNDEYDVDELSSTTKKDRSTVQKQIKTLFNKNLILRRQTNLDEGGYKFYYRIKDKEGLKEMIKTNFDNYQKQVISAIEKM